MSGPKAKSRIYTTRKLTNNLVNTIDSTTLIVLTVNNNSSANKDYEYVMSYSDFKAILTGTAIAGSAAFDSISELTSGADITLAKAVIYNRVGTAINSTATATTAAVKGGLITSTSAAATSITLPTATALGTALAAVQGTSFEFIVDNTAGANTVTLVVGAGIVVAKQTSSGDTAVDQLLTVAASATVGIAVFRLVFSSATAAVLFRIG